jgi:hypothetical protein
MAILPPPRSVLSRVSTEVDFCTSAELRKKEYLCVSMKIHMYANKDMDIDTDMNMDMGMDKPYIYVLKSRGIRRLVSNYIII